MKRTILAFALAACLLMAFSGCAGTNRTPTQSDSPAIETASPDSTPQGNQEENMDTEQTRPPQESTPITEGGTVTPPDSVPPAGATPPPVQTPPAQVPPVQSPSWGGTTAPSTTPPPGAAVPPSKVPAGSQPPITLPPQSGDDTTTDTPEPAPTVPEISQINNLKSGFSSASFSGNDGFEAFLQQGGASTDAQVAEFLSARLLADVAMTSGTFGCSTIAVKSPGGNSLFGRNFDWQSCDALVVTSNPEEGYASLSTVNMDFISQSGGMGGLLEENDVRVMAALYAPLDGMNEKGLAVSVNMIQDSASINQNTGKSDITTTTAIRLLLNKAASVDEALTLLRQYDMHASMGMMIHFALADTTGRSVVVEYVNNEMIVTDTAVVTNFYLAAGSKHGIGSQQSHERFDILTGALAEQSTMDMDGVQDALDSVSKDDFGEFESTEWSAVFNLSTGEAQYYHRENYKTPYSFSIK